jgi:hypothetical protein
MLAPHRRREEQPVSPEAGPAGAGHPEFLPRLRLDELLAELQGRLQAVAATRDRMRGLLEAVVSISSGLDLESTLRRIVETAVQLVDASYGALGVIGDGGRLAEFIPVGLTPAEITRIEHWPAGHGLLGLLIKEPRALRLAGIAAHPEPSGFPTGCGAAKEEDVRPLCTVHLPGHRQRRRI